MTTTAEPRLINMMVWPSGARARFMASGLLLGDFREQVTFNLHVAVENSMRTRLAQSRSEARRPRARLR